MAVSFNQNLFDGPMQGLTARWSKARGKLRELQRQLRRWREGAIKAGKRPTVEGVQKQVRSICPAQRLEAILKTGLKEVRRGLELNFRTGQTALERLCRVQLGKTLLFTGNADWPEG